MCSITVEDRLLPLKQTVRTLSIRRQSSTYTAPGQALGAGTREACFHRLVCAALRV